jgi:hypothetical protein
MDWLDSGLKLLNSYPTWAKACFVGGLFISGAVLIFAPHLPGNEKANINGPVYLRIKGIKLFPEDPDAAVRVVAYVNDIPFNFPSLGGAKWMKVGPDMNEKWIELPKASTYNIRFEMNRKGATKEEIQKMSSNVALMIAVQEDRPIPYKGQSESFVKKWPITDEYKLYRVTDDTRDATVSAVVAYELSSRM